MSTNLQHQTAVLCARINGGRVRLPLSRTRSLDVIAALEGAENWNILAHRADAETLKARARVLQNEINDRICDNRISDADAAAAIEQAMLAKAQPPKEALTPRRSEQLPNWRIYDRTGGGVTHDVFAKTLEDAIEAGRAWIEDGSWETEHDHSGGDAVYKRIHLACEVGQIIRVRIQGGRYVRPDGAVFILDEAGDLYSEVEGVLEVRGKPARDGDIDASSTDAQEMHDCSGTYTDPLPRCAGARGGEHEWVSTTEMGDEFSTYGRGGTRMSHRSVCRRCGCYQTEVTAGSQRNSDEPLSTVAVSIRDERSTSWLKDVHNEAGWLPEGLTDLLGCSPTVRMTEAEAREWVEANRDGVDLSSDELEHAFAAIYGRRASSDERDEGLWRHVCRALSGVDYTEYTVPVCSDCSSYGDACSPEEASVIANKIAEMLRARFPGIGVRVYPEIGAARTRGPDSSVIAEIDAWVAENWSRAM